MVFHHQEFGFIGDLNAIKVLCLKIEICSLGGLITRVEGRGCYLSRHYLPCVKGTFYSQAARTSSLKACLHKHFVQCWNGVPNLMAQTGPTNKLCNTYKMNSSALLSPRLFLHFLRSIWWKSSSRTFFR